MDEDIRSLNRRAWDMQASKGNRWTQPVSSEAIDAARRGNWQIVLTPTRPVPVTWFADLSEADVLCLASGGGQQGPILAAAGARVTVLDNSPKQLEQDQSVAARDGLTIRTVEGHMGDLSEFQDGAFDLIVHPVSNCFVDDVNPVWAECARVLRPGGDLLAGFVNPLRYLFPYDLENDSYLPSVTNRIPYSDLEQLSEKERAKYIADGEPLEFGHTLSDQIGGQLRAGLVLVDFFEDGCPPDDDVLSQHIQSFIATRARKPRP